MTPVTYTLYLKSQGATDYKPVGPYPLEATPLRGTSIAFERAGHAVCGTVDAVFMPPGCEENCIGTVFVSER